MRAVHDKLPEKFSGKSHHFLAYDCAATLYVPEGVYTGDAEEQVTLKIDDFPKDEWKIVSKLSRRKDDSYLVTLKPAGFVHTQGEHARAEANRMELTRCVEIITSQMLNNEDYYQFGNAET